MVAASAATASGAEPPAPAVIASIELSGVFGTRSAWRFVASQGRPIDDPVGTSGGPVPGAVAICLRRASGFCDPHLQGTLPGTSNDELFAQPHYLNQAQVVHPHGGSGRPLLVVATASLHSGDGDQIVRTQVLAYQRGADRFVRIYDHATGRNNNQEVRYIDAGPLDGDIVSVEPTADAPYGFWVSVHAISAGSDYREVLRYRSATGYADGNPLPVIDSEMPALQRRLGLRRPGSPLPLPAGPCPKPHLIQQELWCE